MAGYEKNPETGCKNLNKPKWKTIDKGIVEGLKNNLLCRLVSFEESSLGITADVNPLPILDGMFILGDKK